MAIARESYPLCHVLVIDDSGSERAALRQLLSQLQLNRIDEVRMGSSALQKLKESDFDLIFSSEELPDVKGTDILQVIRLSAKLARKPFIIITGNARKSAFLEAIELGVTDYIIRPFTFETLEASVHRALGQEGKPFITWSSKYSLGVDEVDEQHKRLIRLINDLHDSISLGRGREIVGWVLEELISYTREHFEEEESLLARHQYPELETHRAQHQGLTGKVLELKSRLTNVEKSGLTVELMQFLQGWLTDHILGWDKRYAPLVIGREG